MIKSGTFSSSSHHYIRNLIFKVHTTNVIHRDNVVYYITVEIISKIHGILFTRETTFLVTLIFTIIFRSTILAREQRVGYMRACERVVIPEFERRTLCRGLKLFPFPHSAMTN